MHAAVAILLPMLLTSQVFCQTISANIGSVNSKAFRHYKAVCSGTCGRVTIKVSATSGDPDLLVKSSKGTSLCSRDGSGRSDSCSATVRDTYFYIRILAYSGLRNAKLEITGGNIERVWWTVAGRYSPLDLEKI